MANTIEARVKQKKDTLANWNANPMILLDGEQAFVVSGSGQPINFKIGDGTKRFSELPFWIQYDQAAFVPISGLALPTPTQPVGYSILGEGTYTHASDNIVVPTGHWGVANWDGSEWGFSDMGALPVVEGTDTLVEEDVPKGKAVIEYVAPIKEKIDLAIETDEEFQVKVSSGDANNFSYETGIMTGWGEIIGKPKGFDHIRLQKFKWSQAGFPITEAQITVRDGTFNGTILAEGSATFDGLINEEKELIVPHAFVENADSHDIWVEVRTNGRLARANATGGSGSRYTTSTNIATKFTTASAVTNDSICYFMEAGIMAPVPKASAALMESIKKQLPDENPYYADIVLPRNLYALVGEEFNIYFDNLIYTNIPKEQLDIDITCAVGYHMERRFWYTPVASEVGVTNFTITVKYNGEVMASKTASLKTSNPTAVANRKVLWVGDSTSTYVPSQPTSSTFIKRLYEKLPNPLTLTFVGTKGYPNMMNESFGGAKLLDFTTAGRTLYKFVISGVSSVPSMADQYTHNGSTYLVVENNVLSGSGYISCERIVGTSLPLSAGTLTKTLGVGDATVSFSEYSVVVSTRWWNPATSQIDFNYYYSNNAVSMSSNDWFCVDLLINDIFGITSDTEMAGLLDDRIARLDSLISAVKAATPGIRVLVCITIPPTISQDGFGVSYKNGQTLKRYLRNLELTQKRLLEVYDTPDKESQNIFVLGIHLGLDRTYNFPKVTVGANARNSTDMVTRYSNGVHPNDTGYWQKADVVWAFLKNKG